MHFIALLSLLATPGSPVLAVAPVPPSPQASPAPLSPDALYSKRALRRAKLLIQMRVMQLRDERLECIRAALQRRLPAVLWEDAAGARSAAAGVRGDAEKCEGILRI